MRKYSLTVRNDTALINRAKLYFERQSSSASRAVTINPYSHEMGWLWQYAYTVSIAGKHGVIIPLQNQMAVAHTKGNFLYPELNALVCVNEIGGINYEIVRLVPDIISANSFTGYVELYGAENKIGNIKDYLKCFDNNPSGDHLYEVMLCVSQPKSGSTEPWDFSAKEQGNPVFVGHAFLTMKESVGTKKIIRNVGFYPEGNVWPYHPSDQGCLNNDSYTSFNIALNIKVTSHQFNEVLSYLSKGNDKGFNYNLNSNNCTNFALDALRAAGIVMPRTVGNWHHGCGLNPGNLGEDLRKMKLGTNMKLITVYQAHGNQGSCY